MIVGVTHNEGGVINKTTTYRGKISTGFAAGEWTNNSNHPVPAGFFRMLKETVTTQRTQSGQAINTKQWILNNPIQDKLVEETKSKEPRKVTFICLYQTPEEFWESSLAMYSQSEGLLCKSHGSGTVARYLQYNEKGERTWIDRQFNGVAKCAFEDCPDYKSGTCKPIGLMKVFPTVDMAPNPYRFETRSINTIMRVESSLSDLWSLLKAAHTVKQIEAGKPIPFDGFFGQKLILWHHKVKSGGRDVYITEVLPSAEFTQFVMEPIKRGISKNVSAAAIAGSASVGMLSDQTSHISEAEAVPMELTDQQEMAVNFGADADSVDGAVEEGTQTDTTVSNAAALSAIDKLADKAKP